MHRLAWLIALVLAIAFVILGLSGSLPVHGEPLAQASPPRDTPTNTPTSTNTPTQTHTPSVPNTATATPTNTPTQEPATFTPTATATQATPTNTTKPKKTKKPQPAAPPPASAHLALGLTADPTAPAAEGKVVYTIQVTNDGTVQSDGVVVTCDVPADMKVLGATAGQGTATLDGNKVTAQLGSLAAGQSTTVTVEAQLKSSVGAGVPLSMTASATADGGLSAISAPVVVQIPSVPNTGFGLTVVLLATGLVLAAIVLIARGLQMRRPTV